ncbi:ATP-grasp domain-containing protein [Rariglobus hedericola]|uniref:ATP-grasp domain-containing protein n=1 Tax=Rariglobus hedericola TaxID=2597822 RepID=A0A556QN51_9BACT|nr:ATP-grasp domain-containing protein [Rariglobus hedericola]TSJ78071.1 ATP-grasp domain-containing protein [Rariglobus hedericola]
MQYLIQNPTGGYALDFIRRMHRRFGARAVCFHTTTANVPSSARLHPELWSKDYIAAHYVATPDAFPRFIEHLRRHHAISAIIPHSEMTVSNAVTLAEGLGLDWVQPAIMRRFRDKFALKSHLRATDPGLRINYAELANSPAHALDIVRQNRLARFVLKPNDGAANMNVGIFSADDPPSLIEDYWLRTRAGTVLLEEFIGGHEYHCNGQIDAEGNVSIIDVGRTHYAETDQQEIVCLRTDQIPFTAPEFALIADYTRRMIVASGLRRSPFHAELRVDESGPCLLECAARLVGAGWARFIHLMHGPEFDVIDLAAHYYGSSEPYGPLALNWKNYDASLLIKIRGVSSRTEKIRHLQGVRETERLPQFETWTEKPALGQHLATTNNLMTSPYALMTRCRTLDEADEVERKIRALIQWNTRPPSALDKVSRYTGRAPAFIRRTLKLERHKESLPVDAFFQ